MKLKNRGNRTLLSLAILIHENTHPIPKKRAREMRKRMAQGTSVNLRFL
jgi:hypothetical protein